MISRQKLLMDFGWKFNKGDLDIVPVRGHEKTYLACKVERGRGPAAADYYDKNWETVDLPHDYVVSEVPDPLENSNHGFLPRKNAWYRKAFRLNQADHGRRMTLQFDGIATYCTVWVNGHLLSRNWSGYTSFEVDFSDVAQYGDNLNVVAVYVDTSEFEGWYYEGGGIYRHVWLNITDKIAVDTWGTWVNPVKEEHDTWKVCLETTIHNSHFSDANVKVTSEIIDDKGVVVASTQSSSVLPLFEKTVVKQTIQVDKPKLWSIDEPTLYRLNTYIMSEGKQIDNYQTTFGFRTIKFSPDKGFFLNGKNIKIKGTSNHQDFGSLGVALPDTAHEYRIRRLKEMGCNGYRCGHNPPAPELLDACDKLGMIVVDENRWFDSSQEVFSQLESMIRRDRNHPSVVLWSMGNEEPIQGTEKGRLIMEAMSTFTKKLDNTRAITFAMSGGFLEKQVSSASEVIGINYSTEFYDSLHEMHPDKPIVALEAAASSNSRGIYTDNIDKWQFAAYDIHAMLFGNTHHEAWKRINTRPFMMGAFIWTGIEYRGETKYPNLFAQRGGLDHNCYAKDNFYLFQAMWTDKPMVHIVPHWNWEGMEGKNIDVYVYTNAQSAELFLNGHSLGEKVIDPYEQGLWVVPYEPGTLKAVAKRNGKVIAEKVVETVGAAKQLKLRLENKGTKANGEDLAFVTAYTVDDYGREIPTGDFMVEFGTNELGQIIGTGGDPSDLTEATSLSRRMFSGRCQAIIKAKFIEGQLLVTARNEYLGEATLAIELQHCIRRPYVPMEDFRCFLKSWNMSPITNNAYTFESIKNAKNLNTWRPVEIGNGPQECFKCMNKTNYVAYIVNSRIPETNLQSYNTSLVFEEIAGKADIVVIRRNTAQANKPAKIKQDEEEVEVMVTAHKDSFKPESVHIALPGYKGGDRVAVWVMMEIEGPYSGITQRARWEIE